MRSKLTLSVEKKTVRKAKLLANKKNISVSQMFSDFIELNSRIEKKLKALEEASGIIDEPLAAEPSEEYDSHIKKKHGW